MYRILQINKAYHPKIGGVETIIKQYSEVLEKEGYDVEVLTVHHERNFKTSTEEMSGIKVTRCSSLGTFFSLPLSFSFFYHLFRMRNSFDIVHIHEPFPLATLAAYILPSRVKILVTWHSDIVRQKIVAPFIIPLQKKLLRRAQFITTTNQTLATNSSVVSHFLEKHHIVPASISKEEYKEGQSGSNRLANLKLPKKYALFLGRFSGYKGLSVLAGAIDTHPELRNIPLVLAGTRDNDMQSVEKLKTFPQTIVIEGITDTEKKWLFEHAYMFLFPSISPNETFGITQIESLIYGVPVINTNLPTGVPHVSIHGETGYTVEPKDIEGLARAMDDLWNMPTESYKAMSEKAKHRALAEYEDAKMKNELLSLYSQITKEAL